MRNEDSAILRHTHHDKFRNAIELSLVFGKLIAHFQIGQMVH